ncbi:MAG: hypothetical protein GOVbin8609_42 [Prokaryotic dsDNA virus sp.]|nr:MAG: hypothetical protein GOVbin8609_42 [Prokaryotic dsDNA virus sp.]|tara:strand:+ start:23053 stop:24492 length:1440 start_codon:yes stop_codon:yes gene_type:complete
MSENFKKAEIQEEEIRDGLENLVAQLGTEQDKRSHSRFVNSRNISAKGNQDELNAMYRTDWLSGKVVDIIPDDMTREWRKFTSDLDPTLVKKLKDEEDRLQLSATFNQAHKWARLYGTAFIVLSVDDGQEPNKPLNIDKVKKGGLKHIKAIDMHRLSHADITPIANPLDPNYGYPEFYRFAETSVKIHHSRLLRFDGVELPYDEFRRNNYFSDSVLARLYDALTNFVTVCNGSASMVYETNVDVVKVKGLMQYLSSAEGENLLRKRFTMAGMLKSFNNMMLLDQEEDFTTKNNTFSGLDSLLDKFALFLSGACDIPATRLLGSSASGLNATGEGDLKNYYDTVRSLQKREYKPRLDYFDQIMAKSLGINSDNLNYEFNSLFQMTPKEKADLEFQNAQRDQIYLTNNIIPESTVAKELKQNEVYSNIEDEFIAELEEYEDDDADAFTNRAEAEEQPGNETEETENSSTSEEPEESRSQVS